MTFGDKIIVAFMLFVSLIGMLVVNVFIYGNAGTAVVIEVDGQVYARYNFSEITSPKYIEIRTQYGYNKVEIDKDKVRVAEADCPDKLDVLAGWISKSNQMIVCLPNRLVVKIEGKDTGLDGVAY
ncbi:MAG: NusG domain II-containing protein [Clostridia bacterium]